MNVSAGKLLAHLTDDTKGALGTVIAELGEFGALSNLVACPAVCSVHVHKDAVIGAVPTVAV